MMDKGPLEFLLALLGGRGNQPTQLKPGQVAGPVGAYTPQSYIMQQMAAAILNNLSAVDAKYGGTGLEYGGTLKDDHGRRVPFQYVDKLSGKAHRAMMNRVGWQAWDQFENQYQRPEYPGLDALAAMPESDRRAWTEEMQGWQDAGDFNSKMEQDATTRAYLQMAELAAKLSYQAETEETKEKFGSIANLLLRFAVSPKLADAVAPEPDKELYIPDTKRPERMKDK